MSGTTRHRRRRTASRADNHERWMASYMDMVTVMMCLFIVLFAISQIDQQKFTALRDSLAVSFGASGGSDQILDGSSSVLQAGTTVAEPPDVVEDSGGPSVRARDELEWLLELRDEMAADLARHDLEEEVTFTIDERGLIVGLVTENVFFSPASAEMSETTEEVIDTLAHTLGEIDNELAMEGHANILPRTEPYPTNWELSADRATKVLRRFVEDNGIAPGRTHAVGFGDAHPLATEGPDALAVNRRVDVVVLSEAPEHVRELMPQLAASTEEE